MPTDGLNSVAEATDTICAVATPPGAGGLGIVRVSGPAVPDIAAAICGRTLQPRLASLCAFRAADGEVIDTGIALFFPAPQSFTGEHVLELQGHGGRYILNRIMQRALELGARIARAGEFSERAFLNDKIDLVQAEAIADLIGSGSDAAARAAQRSLQGDFSRRVQDLQEKLTALRVFVESSIDFPDEEIDFLAESDVVERVEAVTRQLTELLAAARQGRLLRDGIVLAIIGRPNAGKSSLLNALSGEETAIVTEIPGTTRDVLREHIEIDGIPVHVADTAGIRETRDVVEAEGVRRAREVLDQADVVLLVEDAREVIAGTPGLARELKTQATLILVGNKIDLLSESEQDEIRLEGDPNRVWISAKTGQGLTDLQRQIGRNVGAAEGSEGSFSARQRHVEALKNARNRLLAGKRALESLGAGELLAEELRLAQAALGEITGEMLPDDLLGEIFSTFCIGK
jgi:tRNA modification GTPase